MTIGGNGEDESKNASLVKQDDDFGGIHAGSHYNIVKVFLDDYSQIVAPNPLKAVFIVTEIRGLLGRCIASLIFLS